MTDKQKRQFNRMLIVLKKIHTGYQRLDQIQISCRSTGLSYTEMLEMSYENIQTDAGIITKGVREIK